jgi:hypothetical protein
VGRHAHGLIAQTTPAGLVRVNPQNRLLRYGRRGQQAKLQRGNPPVRMLVR